MYLFIASFDKINRNVRYDRIFGWAFGDTATSPSGSGTLFSNGSNDTLFGGSSNDKLVGDADNDKLLGEAGNDSLNGGQNQDLLNGGSGTNTLTDASGADKFYFDAPSDGIDIITRYVLADDNYLCLC